MSIQVNIFNSGSVPTATELANFINELNTDLDSIVTLNTEQVIEGVKTFWGSKMLKFKQKTSADKLGFTFYDNQGKEVGNFEYDNKNNFRLLALGNYFSAANQEIEGHVGFKVFNKSASSAYRLICPLAGNAKNSIPTLSETYTNFYMPLVFANGATSVMADSTGKVDLSTLIGSGGTLPQLATVATTGDYDDLINKPTLFSGDYTDLTNTPTIPVNLSDLISDSTHRLVTDALISTWNSKSDFSGSYNDLTDKPSIPSAQVNSDWNSSSGVSQILNKPNLAAVATSGSYNDLTDKPTIPTVPAISTNIANDATSDTKTTSPKAVKDFVEGKGYLTQHQDISGKADQTDLEALEDRVEALEQGGTDEYLKLIDSLDSYTSGPVGEIVKYTGQSNGLYTRGWDYEKVSSGSTPTVKILGESNYRYLSDSTSNYPYEYEEQVSGYFGFVYGNDRLPLLTFSTTLAAGDKVVYWDSERTTVTAAAITSVDANGFYIGNVFISFEDLTECPLSKFNGQNNQTCLVKGAVSEITATTVDILHERFYFKGTKGLVGIGRGAGNFFVYRSNFNVSAQAGSTFITTINNQSYQGPFYYTGKANKYTAVSWFDDLDNFLAVGFAAAQTVLIGDPVFKGSLSGNNNFTPSGVKTAVKSIGNTIRWEDNTTANVSVWQGDDYYEFANTNGDIIYVSSSMMTGAPKSSSNQRVFIPTDSELLITTVETDTLADDVVFSVGTPSVYWQPITHPTESPTFTLSKVLVSDANGEVAASSITTDELNALSGISLSVNKLIEGIYKQMKFNIINLVPYTSTTFIAQLQLRNTTISALTQNSYIYFYFNDDVSAEFSSGATSMMQKISADGESTQDVELLFKDGTAVSGNLTSIHIKGYMVVTVKVGTVVNNKLQLYFQDDITDALN